jgi:uncharacterized protein YdhG (YjbR/CyaY superfamily)
MSSRTKRGVNNTDKVNAALDALDHPLKAEVEAVREIIKGANENITEEWKWNAPSFSYQGEYLVTFNLREQKRVHLVFHNPAIPRVESRLLEGDYEDRRMAYLSDMDDVQAKNAELEKVVSELIALIDGATNTKSNPEPESDLPKLAAPARRALDAAGYVRLEQLTSVTESELAKLHGMGPNALGKIRDALEARGLSFVE